jgi:hypothetical protein
MKSSLTSSPAKYSGLMIFCKIAQSTHELVCNIFGGARELLSLEEGHLTRVCPSRNIVRWELLCTQVNASMKPKSSQQKEKCGPG